MMEDILIRLCPSCCSKKAWGITDHDGCSSRRCECDCRFYVKHADFFFGKAA